MTRQGYTGDAITGVLIGVAALLPSISAGTVAVITNRYTFILQCIDQWRSIILAPIRRRHDILRGALIAAGASLAVLTLAPTITWLLTDYEAEVTSVFAGLILATALVFLPRLNHATWKPSEHNALTTYLPIISGAALIAAVSTITTALPLSPWTAPILAVAAITAMLLPGVSGSYVLLILGAYNPMLNALTNPESHVLTLVIFTATAILYAEQAAGIFHRTIQRHERAAYHGIFAMLLAGAAALLINLPATTTTASFTVLGLATYPFIDAAQTNKSR